MTVRDTPQQNGKIERAIATIWDRVRATMNSAGLNTQEKNKMWGETFKFCVDWWNSSTIDETKETPEEIWSGSKPKG